MTIRLQNIERSCVRADRLVVAEHRLTGGKADRLCLRVVFGRREKAEVFNYTDPEVARRDLENLRLAMEAQ